ncbi:helix-turn-helix transcriptional regulator [Mesorhizobium sp. ES1-6]|uniref:helix-turn-helix transcriptional regulator n=1 Tax=Mesorhizobium sp. ES1-6 TaxID=2876626 RepID=UPI001CCAFA4F|nr:LuxR family transcriptional regulator [Mesorhizobium sp. ES1-6]MBZ9801126.1 LuxR family transcriptional regulator [Mesorhizobium sp. ES1-6]
MARRPERPNAVLTTGNTRNWRRRLDDTCSVLEGIRRSGSPDEICRSLLAFAGRFGATNLLAGQIPQPGSSRNEQLSHVLLDAWPKEWSVRYFSNGYLYHDPTIGLVCRDSPPFLWRDACRLSGTGATGARIMAEATEFRLRDGMTVALRTVEGMPVGFSVAGESLDIPADYGLVLQLIAAFALGHAISLVDGKPPDRPVRLSTRQKDVLRWAAEGLTIEGIAERLTISRNTVDTHLRVVRERLGVGTTIHAVAEALRLSLID